MYIPDLCLFEFVLQFELYDKTIPDSYPSLVLQKLATISCDFFSLKFCFNRELGIRLKAI